MSTYGSFEEFARSIESTAPTEWEVTLYLDGDRAFYQRDDLYGWMVDFPHDQDWPATEVNVHLPNELDGIPDRPNVPLQTLADVNPASVIAAVTSTAPEYNGAFEWDEE